MLAPWNENYDTVYEKQNHHFSDNGPYGQNYGFSSSHVWVWDVGYKRRLSTKVLMLSNCVAGEDSWESLIRDLPYKKIKKKKKNPKGNQSWIFIEKTDA